MIKASFYYEKIDISLFKISGHANSMNENSKYDLVCAGVSAVVFGILNSIPKEGVTIDVQENNIEIKVNYFDEKTQIILKTLLTSLETIENNNKKYIEISIK